MKYGNKEIEVVASDKGYHYVMRFTTGGEMPADLSGMYTSRKECMKAVETYLVTNNKAAKKAAKSEEVEA